MDRYDLLYRKYRSQMSTIIPDLIVSKDDFEARFASELKGMHLIEINGSRAEEGFLYYALRTDEVTHCFVPVYGYYAENEKTMVRLFQQLADAVVKNSACEFLVDLYSGDAACLNAFHMM